MKLACRNCGYDLVEFDEAVTEVQAEYNYSVKELESSHIIQVWCPTCAVADHRVSDISDVTNDFYWEVKRCQYES